MDLGPEDMSRYPQFRGCCAKGGREGGREREKESACALNASLSP